jgi:hypothetical protein
MIALKLAEIVEIKKAGFKSALFAQQPRFYEMPASWDTVIA